ncbi:unnamed protein product [Rhizophagus irregularis]|nr:unnamed protein product [Rhizophagus irregularis]
MENYNHFTDNYLTDRQGISDLELGLDKKIRVRIRLEDFKTVGEITVGEMVVGETSVGEIIVGEMVVGETSVGEIIVGEMSKIRCFI